MMLVHHASELRKAMIASASLHSLLLKYVQVFMVQTAIRQLQMRVLISTDVWRVGY